MQRISMAMIGGGRLLSGTYTRRLSCNQILHLCVFFHRSSLVSHFVHFCPCLPLKGFWSPLRSVLRRPPWACLVACPLVSFSFLQLFVTSTSFERSLSNTNPYSSFRMLQLSSFICLVLIASPLLISAAPARFHGKRAASDVTVFSKSLSP